MALPGRLVPVLRLALGTLSAIALIASVLFGWLFYEFYLRLLPLFENGSHYDPVTETVYHDSGFVSGLFMAGCLLVAAVPAIASRRMKIAGRIR
jgi:hypothetical protein